MSRTDCKADNMLHGGEIYALGEIRQDFSVNINPFGVPEEVLQAIRAGLTNVKRYPDRACTVLREALSIRLGLPGENILFGNGASELIMLLVLALRPNKALLPVPSFSGYEHALRGAGVPIDYFMLTKTSGFRPDRGFLEALVHLNAGDMIFLCSPANPVGNTLSKAFLMELSEECRSRRIWLILDECFIGFLSDEDNRTMRQEALGNPYLFVLDAFTKRYACPGLRLGYLMGDAGKLEEISRLQPEWSVSALAQIAGTAALHTPMSYLEDARLLITTEREYLTKSLTGLGFIVYPGEANYMLFEATDAIKAEIFSALLNKGFLIRHCANYKGLDERFYRIAIKKHEENLQLITALQEILH